MSHQGQESQLVTGAPKTLVEGACIGRKLPRTPEEYAELATEKRVGKSQGSSNTRISRGTGNVNSLESHTNDQPKTSCKPLKFRAPSLSNISDSSSSSHSEADECATAYPPYIVLVGGTGDGVRQPDAN